MKKFVRELRRFIACSFLVTSCGVYGGELPATEGSFRNEFACPVGDVPDEGQEIVIIERITLETPGTVHQILIWQKLGGTEYLIAESSGFRFFDPVKGKGAGYGHATVNKDGRLWIKSGLKPH